MTLDDFVRTYEERLNSHDVDAVLELCADDVTVIWPIDVFKGRAEFRQALETLYRAFPDFRRQSDVLVVSDGLAAAEFVASGTFTGGPFGGYEPTGKGGVLHGADIIRVTDGQLVRSRVFYDQMEFAREVGLLPEQGSASERAMSGMINAVTKVRSRLRR
jgi:steroid delta-isomerase-like uncharacterized protein